MLNYVFPSSSGGEGGGGGGGKGFEIVVNL